MASFREGEKVIRLSNYGRLQQVVTVLRVTAKKVSTTEGDYTASTGSEWGFSGSYSAACIRHPKDENEVAAVMAEEKRQEGIKACARRINQISSLLNLASVDDLAILYRDLVKFRDAVQRKPDA